MSLEKQCHEIFDPFNKTLPGLLMNRLKQFCELFLLSQSFFLWPKVFYFYFVYTRTIFPLGVLYPGHSQLAFDCVIMACSSESIRPGL